MRRRSFLGPLRAPAGWASFAEEIGGTFLEGKAFRNPLVVGSVDGWAIAFVASSRRGYEQTLAAIPFASRDGFGFRLRPLGALGRLLRRLRPRATLLAGDALDRDYAAKTNDEGKLRGFLSTPEIRRLVHVQAARGPMRLEAREASFLEETHELRFVVDRIVTDVEELRTVHALLAEGLSQLRQMGSAAPEPPPSEEGQPSRL